MDENNNIPQQPVQPPVQPQQPYAAPQQAYASQPAYTPAPNQPVGNAYGYPPAPAPVKVRSAHPVLNAVKNLGASPLFMVAVIGFTVMVLFSLLGAFVNNNSLYALLLPYESQLNEFGLSVYTLSYYLGSLQSTFTVWKIIGLIPSILMLVGMWMTFVSARESRTGGMKTTGLTIIKVISVLALIGLCALTALLVVAALILLIALSNEGGVPTTALGAVIVIAMIAVAVLVLYIVYYAKIVSTINTMKVTIATGCASDKISGYVGVIAILSGIRSALSIFSSANVLELLATIGSATASIAFGIFLFRYRTTMRGFLNTYAQPAPAAVPAPAAAPAPTYAQPAAPVAPAAPQPQAETAFCPFCGQAHSAADTACPHCGKPLA